MRKLILVALLLVIVLLLSWWAKGANFSLLAMMQHFSPPQVVVNQPKVTQATTASPTPLPIEIIITLTPNGFVPDVIMINPNTKITWINKTPFTANVSSDSENNNTQFSLGDFGENGSVSQSFPKAGRYSYYNTKNPGQKGTLVVK